MGLQAESSYSDNLEEWRKFIVSLPTKKDYDRAIFREETESEHSWAALDNELLKLVVDTQ